MGDTTHCLAMSDKSMFDKLEEAARKNPLDAVSDEDVDKLDTDYSGDSSSSSIMSRDNPHDQRGSGYPDDEEGKAGEIPGEQSGVELDIHAENRTRNLDGEFL